MSLRYGLLLSGLLLCVLLLVHSLLWGKRSLTDIRHLDQAISQQQQQNKKLHTRNEQIYRKIVLLKTDPEYVQGIARQQLGMVKQDEVFYQYALSS